MYVLIYRNVFIKSDHYDAKGKKRWILDNTRLDILYDELTVMLKAK